MIGVGPYYMCHVSPDLMHAHPRSTLPGPRDSTAPDARSPALLSAGPHPFAIGSALIQLTAQAPAEVLDRGRAEAEAFAAAMAAEIDAALAQTPAHAERAEKLKIRGEAQATVRTATERFRKAKAAQDQAIAAFKDPRPLRAELDAAKGELESSEAWAASVEGAVRAADEKLARERAAIARQVRERLRTELEAKRAELLERAAAVAVELGAATVALAESERALDGHEQDARPLRTFTARETVGGPRF